jgi:hypothetical protein
VAAIGKLLQQHENLEAHEHLRRQCPWYLAADEGEDVSREDPECCQRRGKKPEAAAPRLVVKLTPRTAEASTVVQPTVPPGGPGLFRIKGEHLPPYVEHLYRHLSGKYGEHKAYGVAVGIVKKWAAGVNPGGKHPTKTHADVRAAAARNVAEWEASRAKTHARGHHEHVRASAELELAGALNVGTVTSKAQRGFQAASAVAGRYSQYGLHQHSSQTVSPSPPLPPEVPLPTPQEVRKLIPSVPQSVKEDLSRSVKTFLETAAVKLEKNDEQQALASLRSAQAALYSAHKADLQPYHAAIYNAPGSASAAVPAAGPVPPAAQSSATALMYQGREQQLAWRKLSVAVAGLIERLRKRYFHGHINGVLPNLRLSEEEPVSSLEKIELAAGARVTTGNDVSFPAESDTSQETRLLQPKDNLAVSDFKAKQELAAAPPLSKIAIQAHLNAARDAYRGGNRVAASSCLARACAAAKSCCCHHLVKELHRHICAVAAEENGTHTAAEDAYRPLKQDSPQTVADTGNARLSASLR